MAGWTIEFYDLAPVGCPGWGASAAARRPDGVWERSIRLNGGDVEIRIEGTRQSLFAQTLKRIEECEDQWSSEYRQIIERRHREMQSDLVRHHNNNLLAAE